MTATGMTATGNRLRYVSTRGGAAAQDFTGVLMAGLASDGGLYLPEAWPQLAPADWQALAGKPYAEAAFRVLRPFTAGALDDAVLARLTAEAYAQFDHAAVCPLVQIAPSRWLLELFHGPTLAFKDVALQLLGLLFEEFLERENGSLTIVGATSMEQLEVNLQGFGVEWTDELEAEIARVHNIFPDPWRMIVRGGG